MSIKYAGRADRFRGRVSSEGPRRCVRERVVSLRKKRPGRDRALGASTTNRRGRWSIGRVRNPDGAYYAVVRATRFEDSQRNTVVCRSARSRTIRP